MVESGPKIEPNRTAVRTDFISGTISREARAAEGFLRSQRWYGVPRKQANVSLRIPGSYRTGGYPKGGSWYAPACQVVEKEVPPRPRGCRKEVAVAQIGVSLEIVLMADTGYGWGMRGSRLIFHVYELMRVRKPCAARISADWIAISLLRTGLGA